MRSIARTALPVVGAALTIVGAVTFAASSGRAQTRPAPTAESAFAAAQAAQVATVTFQQDSIGLHDLEEDLAAGRPAPSYARGRIRRARIAIQATQWPDAMQAKAADFVATAQKIEGALLAEDWTTAAPLAKTLHDAGHDLSDMAYTWLGSLAGAPAAASTTPDSAGPDGHSHSPSEGASHP
ncbi:MAG: hypothetical protein U0531_09265 [Dehalococcoidia bacterium]